MKYLAAITAACVFLGLINVGCVNLGGGRQAISLPFSAPNFAMDSQAVQQKNDDAAGAQFSGTGLNPVADQQINIGNDAANSRSTDASLAAKQSNAQGRESGNIQADGPRTLDDSAKLPVNVGPGGGANLNQPAPATP